MRKTIIYVLLCTFMECTMTQAQSMKYATPELVKRCHFSQFFCHDQQKGFIVHLYCGVDGIGIDIRDEHFNKNDEVDIDCSNKDIVMSSNKINISESGKAECKLIEIRNHFPTFTIRSVKPKDGMEPSVYLIVFDERGKEKARYEFDYDADYEEGTSIDFYESAEKMHNMEGCFTEGVDNCMDYLFMMIKNYVE